MRTRPRSLVALIFLCLFSPTVMAQTITPVATTAEAEVTITVQRQQVRFAAAGTLREWRLEIHDQAGQLIHDSGLVTGSEIAWPLLNAEAQAVASGLYVYTLTFKELHAPAAQVRRGHVIIDRVAERKGDRLWVTARSERGVEITASESEDIAIAGVRTNEKPRHNKSDDDERAGEAEDKEASAAAPNAQTVTGKGTPNQLVRTGEPLRGVISTRKRTKARASDEPGVDSSNEPPSTSERTTAISNRLAPDTATATSQSVTGSGTLSQAAKWTATSVIGDSIITDTGTNVGIGTTTPGSKLTVAGAIDAATEYNLNGKRILTNPGGENLFVGIAAGVTNTDGVGNTFVGGGAGFLNTRGEANSFFGKNAGYTNVTGSANTFFGYQTGYDNKGNNNAFFGASAGYKTTAGNNNVFVGSFSGHNTTTGDSNSFIGRSAGINNTSGPNNTFVGWGTGASNTTESHNTFIGYAADGDPNITFATAIGARQSHPKL